MRPSFTSETGHTCQAPASGVQGSGQGRGLDLVPRCQARPCRLQTLLWAGHPRPPLRAAAPSLKKSPRQGTSLEGPARGRISLPISPGTTGLIPGQEVPPAARALNLCTPTSEALQTGRGPVGSTLRAGPSSRSPHSPQRSNWAKCSHE